MLHSYQRAFAKTIDYYINYDPQERFKDKTVRKYDQRKNVIQIK